uniref:Uncharacterized protein n=1 Tax=Roseihalotalea indica TaxID=2867963 RepID=A0AA49GI98_9BACT|nr:hypothetical protein K4G66_23580 [Tunicatimonas sp. TK19036]
MSSEKLVHRSEKAINGVLNNSGWQKKMAALGFSAEELTVAKAMGGELQQLAALQQKEYGEQYSATDAMHQAKKEAWQVYKNHLQVARIALAEDRGQYKALQLGGERERNILKWVKQARTFYANAKNVSAQLKTYGIKPEDLAQGESMIEAVYQAYDQRDKERDEARQSTQARKQVEAKLSRWMKRYERALRFAFEEQPEVLKELGLKVKEEAV